MNNVTFKEVNLTQSEAENIVEKKQPTIPGTPVSIPSEVDKITPPLSVYKALKGVPYTVEYLGLKDVWGMATSTSERNATFGNLEEKIGLIEGWLASEAKKNFLPDSIESHKMIMRMIDKIVHYSNLLDPLKKIDKICNFLLSKNKEQAFDKLRVALMNRSIDQIYNKDEEPSIELIGKFMPRKE